jgi:hypothetical protein
MNAKRFFAWLLPAALALCAFGRPPAPRPDSNPDVLFQFLTVVNADGSAEFHYNLKYSKAQVQKNMDRAEYPEDQMCAKTTADLEASIGEFKQEKHGDEVWCTYAMTFDNLQGLNNHLEDDFSVRVGRQEIRDGKYYLDLSWSRFPCTTNDPAQFSCEWAVRAPGAVSSSNATRVEGNTLLWDMSAPGAVYHFTAETGVGGFDPTVLILIMILLCGCCGTLLLIAAGVGVFLYLRRRNATAVPAAADSPAAQPSPAETVKL